MASRLSTRVIGLTLVTCIVAAAVVLARPTTGAALPAYAAATGQACSACHVNPAGGGTLTNVGQAFQAVPTHATDPAGAFAQVTPATQPAPAAQPTAAPTSAPTAPATPARTGQQVFSESCAVCHGELGQGKVGVPTLAGYAGHLQRAGISPENAAVSLTPVLRSGIPGRMPSLPSDVLSDADIASLSNYLVSLPPATGDSLYLAQCATCHGLKGEGTIGHPLNSDRDFVPPDATLDQLTAATAKVVHEGIHGAMPAVPQLTHLEVSRIAVHLFDFDQVAAWVAEFNAKQGHEPTIADWNDRAWSLDFVARFGKQPTDSDWAAHWAVTNPMD